MNSNRTYFPGLNALRFFAAFVVIIHHVEQYKSWQKMDNVWGNQLIDEMGHIPVSFFFVLSGFLITYLLLQELNTTETINLRKFYWKRTLRLWPVYYLVVIFALVFVPIFSDGFDGYHFEFGMMIPILLVLFLPNLLRVLHPDLVGGNQLWSVGVEEQFYLIWPFLIRIFHKRMMTFLLGFIGLKLVLEFSLGLLVPRIEGLGSIHFLIKLFPVEQLAIGGIGALLLLEKKEAVMKFLTNMYVFFGGLVGVFFLEILDATVFRMTVEGILFLIVILNVIHRPAIHRWLEVPVLKKLGDASYGMYMYHTLVIAMVLSILHPFKLEGWAFNVILYSASISLTILVSRASFIYMEKPIAKLRDWKFRKHSVLEQRV